MKANPFSPHRTRFPAAVLFRTAAAVFAAAVLVGPLPCGDARAANGNIPLSVQVVLHEAQQQMEADRPENAVQGLERANVPRGRRHHLISFLLGNAYLMLDRPGAAEHHFADTVALAPDYHPGWMNLAKSRYDTEAYAAAADAFVEAYRTAPEPDPSLLFYAAASRVMDDDPRGAMGVFERLLRDHPDAIELEWREAMVQTDLALDRRREALAHMVVLAEQSSGERKTRWQEILLYHYLSLGMRDRALEWVHRLTRENPLEEKWWKGQVHLFLESGRSKDALTALAVKDLVAPLGGAEVELLGDLYLSVGVPKMAARAYRRALDEGFAIETAHKLVGAYRRMHRPGEALRWAEKSLSSVSDGRMLLVRADLLYELERWEAAAAAYREAMPHAKSEGRIWWMLGHCAAMDGDIEEARSAWKKAMGFPAYRKRAAEALGRWDGGAAKKPSGSADEDG